MKKFGLFFLFVMLFSLVLAQLPEKMSYQAVVRDGNGNLIKNANIGMQISILKDAVDGIAVYVETHLIKSNTNGLVTLEIGTGTVEYGSFSAIKWSDGIYFIKTETDPDGGILYSISGTSQILSVPYAFHAKTSDSLIGGIKETDPYYINSPAATITDVDIDNWTKAYLWGDHSQASYVKEDRKIIVNTDTFDLSDDIVLVTGTVTSITASNGIGGGTITTSGTIGLTGQANAVHNLNTNGIITRTGNAVIEARKLDAGSGIIIENADGVAGNPSIAAKTYKAGDFVHGGIVFWVDATGQHGLVCAKVDQSTSMRWHAGTNISTMALGNGPFAGYLNTALIIAGNGIGDSATYAARVCNELRITEGGKTYGDWYLPSVEELTLMFHNRSVINSTAYSNGGTTFATGYYWSSSEFDASNAWMHSFSPCCGLAYNRAKTQTALVRAIRRF